MILAVVSIVDQTKFAPVVVNVDVPQLSTTVTICAEGSPGSDNACTTTFEAHPLSKVIL